MPIRILIGVVAGGLGGYLWYRLVGCSSGACPITSNPYISVIFGVIVGLSFALH